MFFLRTFESTRFHLKNEPEGHWFAGLGQEVLQKPSAKPRRCCGQLQKSSDDVDNGLRSENLVKHGEAFYLGDW